MEDIPHPPKSLVKFNDPIRLNTRDGSPLSFTYSLPDTSYNVSGLFPGSVDTREFLRSVLPPRTWREGSVLYTQEASPNLSTREDILRLQTLLEFELESRQARSCPLCPVREDLFTQAFDELIRQVSIECSERGLFLLRLRDERRMTVESYQTLYYRSAALSSQLGSHLQKSLPEVNEDLKRLKHRKQKLLEQVTDLQRKLEMVTEREQRQSRESAEQQRAEIEAQEKKNHHLRSILEQSKGSALSASAAAAAGSVPEKEKASGVLEEKASAAEDEDEEAEDSRVSEAAEEAEAVETAAPGGESALSLPSEGATRP